MDAGTMEVAKGCGKVGCTADGVWQPVLQIWPQGVPHEGLKPIEMLLGFALCGAHRDEFNLSQWSTSPEQRKMLTAAFRLGSRTRLTPDFAGLRVRWNALSH